MSDLPEELVDRVRRRLADSSAAATPTSVAAALRSEGLVLADIAVLEVVRTLQGEIAGLGILEPLLRDPNVTDVLVNSGSQVWVDRGRGLERTALRFRDDAAVRRLAQRLAASAGRRLDDSSPFVDARLPQGIRLHAVLPPICPAGVSMSLRIPRRKVFSLSELVTAGAIPEEAAGWLRGLVAARLAFLIVGGTGTGKTTLLNCLLSLADTGERIVIVEDSAELEPSHPHVVRLEARPANVEGVGLVTLRDLVRQALRMRPDRLVVGEVRGSEVVDLLAALNTGHEGGCGTLHANSAEDAPARLEALAMTAGMGREALHAQVAAGLDAVVGLTRSRDGRRAVVGIDAVVRAGDGYVGTRPAVRFAGAGVRTGSGLAALGDRLEPC